MRKMYSKNQIENIVNDGIEAGTIEVDALPEIESGDAGKVLTVNEGETGAVWAEASGGKLYEHNIIIYRIVSGSGNVNQLSFRIISDSATSVTNNVELASLLKSSGYDSDYEGCPVSGYARLYVSGSYNSKIQLFSYAYSIGNGSSDLRFKGVEINLTDSTLSDISLQGGFYDSTVKDFVREL